MALTDIKVRTAKPTDKQYKLTDGSSMYLLAHPNGSRYWRLQYRFGGKQKMLALGVYPDVSLADVRTRRDDARKLLAHGIDPGDKKKTIRMNKKMRVMGYNTKVEVCGHDYRTIACSSLIKSGVWSRDAVERQMSHMERNSVRAAYIYKAEHLDERRLMLQWWADYLDVNRKKGISPFGYSK